MEIVNMVATGSLNVSEVDLESVYQDLDQEIADYYPGRLEIRFDDETPMVMMYPAGTYTIPGAQSVEEIEAVRERLDAYLSDMTDGFLAIEPFEIKYIVFMEDYGADLDLELVTVQLGLSCTEYEPEQFPAVIYRAEDPEGVVLIFASGKLLFTGFESREAAEAVQSELHEEFDSVLNR